MKYTMDATTVKLHRSTKSELERLRNEQESYDDVIRRLASQAKRENLKKELIAGYKGLGRKDLAVLKEWDKASAEF